MSDFIDTINQQVNFGFIQAATLLAKPYQILRPGYAAPAALDPSNLLGSTKAYLTTDAGLTGKNPPQAEKPIWYGAFDTTQTEPGDYLVGVFGTFFVATQLLPQPPSLVFCNATVSLTRITREAPSPFSERGEQGVSADGSPVAPYALSFPCSLVPGERRSTAELHLPGETQLPSATLLLPLSIPEQIVRSDIALTADDQPTQWTVQSAIKDVNYWTVIAVNAGA